jgi:hypothetical protein
VENGGCWSRLWKNALAWGSGAGGCPVNEKKERAGLLFGAGGKVLVGQSRMRGDSSSLVSGGGFL